MEIIYILITLLVLIFLYLFLIAPGQKRPDALKPFCHVDYAHRGLHNNHRGVPENSILAFTKAVSMGYGIELDVQLTKDEKVIVFHDDTLSRVCGIDLLVREKTYDELMELSLFHTEEKIPLLSDVLQLVNGHIPLLIEIKLPIRSTRTCELVNEELKDYQGHYCIESFNTLAIHWYKKNRPDIVRGQLSSKLTKSISEAGFLLNFIVENLLSNFLGRPDFISYCYADTAKLSFWLNKHLFSAMTMAWTITTPEVYAAYLTKFDAFIFEGFHTRT